MGSPLSAAWFAAFASAEVQEGLVAPAANISLTLAAAVASAVVEVQPVRTARNLLFVARFAASASAEAQESLTASAASSSSLLAVAVEQVAAAVVQSVQIASCR